MEIKINCACGTKFKFDVEPVHGRMPAPLNCPSCGAEATAQANAIIAEAIAATEPASPPPSPAAAPAPGGLRINRPATPAPSEADAALPRPIVPTLRPKPISREDETKNPLVKALVSVLVVALIALGAWQFGNKWYKRLNFVAQAASTAGEAGVESESSEGAKNLWYEDCAVLLINHTNHLEVADACKEFWKTKLNKTLTLIDSAREYAQPGEYELVSAHNGFVRIVGAHDWPVPQHEALAQQLSQRFGTLVFEWRSEHFADTYHFGVYDAGSKKFHAQMDVKISADNADEIVTTEGNDYAIAHGYKPGKEGFKEFNVLDADKITRQLGMKLWDEKEGTEMKGMLLQEAGAGKSTAK